MSIEKISWDKYGDNEYELMCDECGELELINGDYKDVLDFIKENDWSSKKENGEWINLCPSCVEKFKGN